MEREWPPHEHERDSAHRRGPRRSRGPGARARAARLRVGAVEPAGRARETAALAGFADPCIDDDLVEWDYGELEGLTSVEIQARGGVYSDWTIWTGPVPGGENIDQVAQRLQRVVDRVAAAAGDVICFGHGHTSRVLAAVALDLGPQAGAHLALDPASISVVGAEHAQPALRAWNARPGDC